MSKLKLQLSLFDKTQESVALTEIDGQEVGMILQYYDLDAHQDREVMTCAGDLFVIINALEDYARLLEDVIKEWGLEGYHAYTYELHAARCRKISQKYQDATGYDYDAAMERCRKKKEKQDDDVGEEALTLLNKYGRRDPSKKAETTAKAGPPAPAQPDPDQLTL